MNKEPSKIADAKTVADKLAELPKDALFYIAGYAEGIRYQQRSPKPKPTSTKNSKDSA